MSDTPVVSPVVSVVMPTYNHAPFVAQAIDSVLAQSFKDFELIISDDGSSDATRDVVATFDDPRIRWYPHTQNRGACAVINEMIDHSRGRYVAMINSDDFWEADKLAYQVDFLETHPDYEIMFGRARFVDRQSEIIDPATLEFGAIFDQENRSPAQWLRYFFEKGNCLCHPTMLIRRECYDRAGRMDNRLRQLPDYELWIRFCKQFRLFVSDRVLINFRILPGENVSAPSRINHVRTMNEHFLVARDFFNGMKGETLTEGFGDLLRNKFVPSRIHAEIEQALLFFHDVPHLGHAYKLVGLEKLYALLASPEHRAVLLTDYAFDDRALQKLAAEADALKPEAIIIEVPVPGPRVVIEVLPVPEIYIKTFSRAVVVDDLKRRLREKLRRAVGRAA